MTWLNVSVVIYWFLRVKKECKKPSYPFISNGRWEITTFKLSPSSLTTQKKRGNFTL